MLPFNTYDFDEDLLPFEKPWHAELFAITILLIKNKIFSWPEWTSCFSEKLQQNRLEGMVDGGDDYYTIWLNTITDMIISKNITDVSYLYEVTQLCVSAYLTKPHSKQ